MNVFETMEVFNENLLGQAVQVVGGDSEDEIAHNGIYLVKEVNYTTITLMNFLEESVVFSIEQFKRKNKPLKLIVLH